MLEYLITGILLSFILSPIGLLVGRKINKLSQLRIWHIWLALVASILIGCAGFYIQILSLFGGIGLTLCWIIIAALVIYVFHRVLGAFMKEIQFSQSFSILFIMLMCAFLLVAISVPFLNRLQPS